MCHFASGVVTRDGRILVGDLQSHNGIAGGWGLKPGEYREWELQSEGMGHLELRTEAGDDRAEWVSAFAAFPNRTALLASIEEGRKENLTFRYLPGGGVALRSEAERVELSDARALTSVDLPKATYVELYDARALTSVDLPKATYVELYGARALTSVDLPKATDVRLYGASALTSVDLPKATDVRLYDAGQCMTWEQFQSKHPTVKRIQ
jgi:hypothetical protein